MPQDDDAVTTQKWELDKAELDKADQAVVDRLRAAAQKAEENAYNHGFCRGMATALVIGAASGRITEADGAALLKQLQQYLSPSMQAQVEECMKELIAQLKLYSEPQGPPN